MSLIQENTSLQALGRLVLEPNLKAIFTILDDISPCSLTQDGHFEPSLKLWAALFHFVRKYPAMHWRGFAKLFCFELMIQWESQIMKCSLQRHLAKRICLRRPPPSSVFVYQLFTATEWKAIHKFFLYQNKLCCSVPVLDAKQSKFVTQTRQAKKEKPWSSLQSPLEVEIVEIAELPKDNSRNLSNLNKQPGATDICCLVRQGWVKEQNKRKRNVK